MLHHYCYSSVLLLPLVKAAVIPDPNLYENTLLPTNATNRSRSLVRGFLENHILLRDTMNPPHTQANSNLSKITERDEPLIGFSKERPPWDPDDHSPPGYYWMPNEFANRVSLDTRTCEDTINGVSKKLMVEDALWHVPVLIQQGVERSARLRDLFYEGMVTEMGGVLGGIAAVNGFCPVWNKLFGMGDIYDWEIFDEWVIDWKTMKYLVEPAIQWHIPGNGVIITCYDSIGDIAADGDPHGTRNECEEPFRTEAITILPRNARVPTVATSQLSYQNVKQPIINLCPQFFEHPRLSDAEAPFLALRKAAKERGSRPPRLPRLEQVDTGARILLHEFFHLDTTADFWESEDSEDDVTGLAKIRIAAREHGFPYMRNKPDANAYFGLWSYYSSLEDTNGCDM